MKFFLIITTCLSLSMITYSQVKNNILYLKDGSVIKGNIVSNNPENIAIKTFHGNIFIYDQEDVQEIKNKHNRYINYTSAGILIGSALNEKPAPFSALTEHNYQFMDYFAVGGVIGIELLKETIVPLGANVKIYFPLQSRTLFIGGSAGHSFSVDKPANDYYVQNTYGGTFANAETGVIIPLNSNNSVFFALGFRYNELKYKYEDWWYGNVDRTYYLKRLSMRFGLALY